LVNSVSALAQKKPSIFSKSSLSITKTGGSIVTNIKLRNRILSRTESSKQIDHFKKTHTERSPPPCLITPTDFPDLPKLERNHLKRLLSRFSAKQLPSMDYGLFRIHSKCSTANRLNKECPECNKKINFSQKIWNKDFWWTQNTIRNFKTRLIPLNKYPHTPKVDRYRPIIVMSLFIKLLEMYVLLQHSPFTTSRRSK
jgi:hypothetical protein